MSKIIKTSDLDLFKFMDCNRDFSVRSDLTASMDKHGFLPTNPIIVDNEMNVIDGQHRLAAAKSLGIPVYYVVVDSKESPEEYMRIINNTSKKWDGADYVKYYKNLNRDSYHLIDKLYNKGMSIRIIISSFGTNQWNGNNQKNFKNGSFVFGYPENIVLEICDVYIECYNIIKAVLAKSVNNTSFHQALIRLIKHDGFMLERFRHQCQQYPSRLLAATKFKNILDSQIALLEMYNLRSRNPLTMEI